MRTERLDGSSVAIIGLGVSGHAAARLALTLGGQVYVSDSRAEPPTGAGAADLRALGAEVEWGGHDLARLARADLVVVSPGVPPHASVLRALGERGVRWISEPELAFRFLPGPLIAVTGTNGKTTTTLLVGHLLDAAGLDVAVGGNVGGGLAPAASELALRATPADWYVLEMSSFQLAGVERFRPDIGVVTNLSPDHLDRYAGVADYYADKARLFQNADAHSRWVLPLADDAVAALVGDAPGERYWFSDTTAEGAHAFVDAAGTLTLALEGTEALLEADRLPLLGAHNRTNALAAALTAGLAGAGVDGIAKGLGSARPLPHRMEPVAERGDVLWVNDSKATNVAATLSALRSLDRPVVLLVGGKDKGEDLHPLRRGVEGRVRQVIAFGAAAERIAGALEGAVPIDHVRGDLSQVVAAARAVARPGDIVLLSPACSSFDMFESYEHRGRAFARLAREHG